MAITNNLSSFDSSSSFKFREAFAQAGNILPGYSRDIKFWGGQRYYQRKGKCFTPPGTFRSPLSRASIT